MVKIKDNVNKNRIRKFLIRKRILSNEWTMEKIWTF